MSKKWEWIFQVWKIVNWHKIYSIFSVDNILCECATCKRLVYKSRKSIQNHQRCKNCKITHAYNSYMYWVDPYTISNRLRHGWTMKQTLWLEPRKIKSEDFAARDLKYLSEFLEKDYNASEELARRCEIKFKTNPVWLKKNI